MGFWLDTKAFGEIVMKSPELQDLLGQTALEVAERCGDGYKASSTVGKVMALAMVWPGTPEAVVDNEENNTLLKSIR